jgi:spore cortex formation protein SpoVR/YcgB (stage V sporulation)
MEKILDKQQRDEIISNPKEPVRTFLRKVHFTLSKWSEAIVKLFRR